MGPWEQIATLYHKTYDKTIGFGTSVARRIYNTEFPRPVLLSGVWYANVCRGTGAVLVSPCQK